MKKLVSSSFMLLLVLSINITVEASPLFLDNVTLSSGWVDVNKTWSDDSLLCWAASSANLLSYTGWFGGNNLMSGTQIFDYYKNHWNNNLGSVYYSTKWWFDGTDNMTANLTDTTHTGFYSTDLWTDNIGIATVYGQGTTALETLMKTGISGNSGLSLSINLYNANGSYTSRHFVTVWGIDTDANKLFVTDSDDSAYGDGLKIYTYNDSTSYVNLTDYVFGSTSRLYQITFLDPWETGDPTLTTPVPIPAALWLFGSGVLGLIGIRRKMIN